jgi:thioredoxin 1
MQRTIAAENQELLRQLKVYGIPTRIDYRNDEERVRYVGAKPGNQLKSLFEALAHGSVPVSNGLSGWDRFVRLLAGGVVVGMGWANYDHWFLPVIGGVLLFSAVYDRCPIWKAITTKFKKVMAK